MLPRPTQIVDEVKFYALFQTLESILRMYGGLSGSNSAAKFREYRQYQEKKKEPKEEMLSSDFPDPGILIREKEAKAKEAKKARGKRKEARKEEKKSGARSWLRSLFGRDVAVEEGGREERRRGEREGRGREEREEGERVEREKEGMGEKEAERKEKKMEEEYQELEVVPVLGHKDCT